MSGLRVLHVFLIPWVVSVRGAWKPRRVILGMLGWLEKQIGRQQLQQHERNGANDSDRSQTAERVYHSNDRLECG